MCRSEHHHHGGWGVGAAAGVASTGGSLLGKRKLPSWRII